MAEILKDKVDAVIVGAGAGGGVIAKQLAARGIKCVILERGDWPDYEDSPNDELINQRTHAIRALHGPDRRKSPRASADGKGGFKPQDPWLPDHSVIAACVGSGTVTYGAMAWRFMPQDFKLKSLYGEIKGSALEDWPIAYEDLEPYYEQAEYEIGVSGDQSTNPFAPPRKKPYPMPAFEYNWEDEHIIKPAMQRLGLHPFPVPMLRNSVRYNGRAACIRNHTCCGYMCPCNAKNGSQNTVIPAAIQTGNCEVRTNARAFEVVMQGRKATAIKYFDENKNVCVQPADIVVVAASAMETARLLYLSKSALFPNGIGNNSDMLGRCLQGHVYCGANGFFDGDVCRELGPGATIAVSDLNHGKGIFAGALCTEFYFLPWARTKTVPPSIPRWGLSHKKFMRENFHRMINIQGPVQEIPMYEARVILKPSVKDFWGLPVYSNVGKKHPKVLEQTKIMTDMAAAILKEAGAKTVIKKNAEPSLNGSSGGQHQAGTCRMGSDPAKSVTNPECKVWGTENIWIGDGSVNVTNGGFNPVLTIMALAFRTGEIIAKEKSKA